MINNINKVIPPDRKHIGILENTRAEKAQKISYFLQNNL